MIPICIYHSNCADGFTAAWVVKKFLGDIKFFPGIHNHKPPNLTGRDVIFVDFVYDIKVMESIIANNTPNSILILDHHKTGAEALAMLQFPETKGYDPHIWKLNSHSQDVPIRAIFDMKRSGAQIAWDFFCPDRKRPLFVDYVGDFDLNKLEMVDSRIVNSYIFSNTYSFENWDILENQFENIQEMRRILDLGLAIESKHLKDVDIMIILTKRRMKIGGFDVPVANIPYMMANDACRIMLQGEAFACCYWDTPNGRQFSLRSNDIGIDVSRIAQSYGGGGHAISSGFRMPLGWEGD
jgi:oligoribonuclease NrnB/cAMP/cGMP phosphodiesterase (DHH superfamily)